jgi:arylsulfatase A-like enzyme
MQAGTSANVSFLGEIGPGSIGVHSSRKKGRCGGSRRGRRRRRARGLALLLGLVACALACSAAETRPQRLVLVTIDTLRADRVGCYGAAGAHTPNLDALAARGARFATAVSPVPLTLPSHATLLTGLDPPEHGVRHNGIFQLGEEIPTLAEAASAVGLRTAAFVAAFVLHRSFGLARGFEVYDDRTQRDAASGGAMRGFAERPADQVVGAAAAWLATQAPSSSHILISHHIKQHKEE